MGETLPPLPPGADMQVRDVLLRPLPNAVAWAQRGSSPALAPRQGGAGAGPGETACSSLPWSPSSWPCCQEQYGEH